MLGVEPAVAFCDRVALPRMLPPAPLVEGHGTIQLDVTIGL
jgi:hypothetical protein